MKKINDAMMSKIKMATYMIALLLLAFIGSKLIPEEKADIEKIEAAEEIKEPVDFSQNKNEDVSSQKETEKDNYEELPVWEKIEDQVLKTMEITINGTDYTMEAIGKTQENGCGIREILVYKEEKLWQTISIKEAIDKDGVDGIDTGYSQCFEEEKTFVLKDVNFDGYEDLEVFGWVPNNNIPYYYWCFDTDTEQFNYAFCLQLTEMDEENKLLISECREQAGVYSKSYYRVDEKNQLELVQTKIKEVKG